MHENINVNVGGSTNANIKHRGTSAERPTDGMLAGFMYFDITIGKPIWWSGEGWVDALGNSVDTAYQKQIDSSHKLSADLVSDGSTNKMVTATEKGTWNGKQNAVTGTAGNFAGFDADGKLADSGSKPSDFEPSTEQNT